MIKTLLKTCLSMSAALMPGLFFSDRDSTTNIVVKNSDNDCNEQRYVHIQLHVLENVPVHLDNNCPGVQEHAP